ncbi:MAG: GAF domain-containing protein [Proteobacteria bacterium]|nr:GAF domain-containing protein [Burkholderiales bacterium]
MQPAADPTHDASLVLAALERVARVIREETDAVSGLAAIGIEMDRLIGSRMFTFLRFDLDRFEMERLYCTLPERYPIGARKPMRGGPWAQRVIDEGEVFIAPDAEAMRATFADHAALAELGCTASMCVPVRLRACTLGTMNLNGRAGTYDAQTAALAQPFATLAVALLLRR